MPERQTPHTINLEQLNAHAAALGFAQSSVCSADPSAHAQHLQNWLDNDYHGDMDWMARHADLRKDPTLLLDGAKSVICVRLDYYPDDTQIPSLLNQSEKAYISRYALGRDYHKLMRSRLAKLANTLAEEYGGNYRALVDSAPVLERHFAEKSGLGWIGKNTMLINRHAGSWFFLGEIYTDIELVADTPTATNHCGSCTSCLDICPTQAFVNAHKLDARRCISYLTIELKDSIPEEFRKPMGNRVFGCDDCQLVCPWNRYAKPTQEDDFAPRHQLDNSGLVDLFLWSEDEFLNNTAGSAIRRIGHERWLRNLSVGLGNAPTNNTVVSALKSQAQHPSPMVQEHVQWALDQHLKNTDR